MPRCRQVNSYKKVSNDRRPCGDLTDFFLCLNNVKHVSLVFVYHVFHMNGDTTVYVCTCTQTLAFLRRIYPDYMSVRQTVWLLSVCLSVCPSVHLIVSLSVCFICKSIYQSICAAHTYMQVKGNNYITSINVCTIKRINTQCPHKKYLPSHCYDYNHPVLVYYKLKHFSFSSKLNVF